jgi:glycosyltransferase involved in cell wall biosynthesis
MAPWCAGLGVRRVVTRRMDYVPHPWARWLYGPGVVDVVIAISAGVRAALRRAGVADARLRVVPSGVDVAACTAAPGAGAALRDAWGLGAEDVAVVLVGVLERRKGHHVLLEAARTLPPRVRLVFCGTGSAEAALRTAAASLGGRVVFAGFQPDVAPCLAAADVVVLPSLAEGLGVAALEGMAAGRPVVASRVGGLAEVVVDGETGLLVAPGDAAGLAAALARMAADPALRARCGAAGRDRVLARYTRARMADGTLACYSEAPCGG